MPNGVIKCRQTGHFFVYYPEHDVGFTCYHCLEDFAASGQKPPVASSYPASRKRRSLHGNSMIPPPPLPPPPPPLHSMEAVSAKATAPIVNVTGDGATGVGGKDLSGKLRSRPWRCLQARCRLLVCDSCSDKLVDPEYVATHLGGEESFKKEKLDGEQEVVGRKSFDDNRGIKAGDSTPTDDRPRTEREQHDRPRRPLPPIPGPQGRIMAPAPPPPSAPAPAPVPARQQQAKDDSKQLGTTVAADGSIPKQAKLIESDGSGTESENSTTEEEIQSRFFYRRAAHVASSALSHYHHRLPGRTMRHPPRLHSEAPGKESAKGPPTSLQQSQAQTQAQLTGSKENVPSRPIPLPAVANDTLEVDSEEEDVDNIPRLTVRSAADAANQALRNYLQKQR